MNIQNSELGKKSAYISEYTPELLFPIARKIKRDEIGIDENNLPFYGIDIWNHYEVSWLNPKGKPMVACAVMYLPATSANIIESKSMKLYFNSFNNHKFASKEELAEIITKDLSQAANAQVKVELHELNYAGYAISEPAGEYLDDLDIVIADYMVNPQLLTANPNKQVKEQLYSNLLKSNCLVTFQPDWATLLIEYRGAQIDREALLRYIISFRNHNEFHEQCVERIFNDISKFCAPDELMVMARFTRRGGLDINPIRASQPLTNYPNLRLIRQ
jgi:7-cyano-7-deazaguanine reductase